MLQSLTLVMIYLSAIVVQQVVEINILAPVELLTGILLLLYAMIVRPKPQGWSFQVGRLIAAELLFIAIVLLDRLRGQISIGTGVLIIIEGLLFLVFVHETGAFLRLRTENEWQERLKQALFIIAFTMVLAMLVYNPFRQEIGVGIPGYIGHTLLALPYGYAFIQIERYAEQMVLHLDENDWLYRKDFGDSADSIEK